MKNIFKAIRTRYIEFLDYRDESQECFVNKKGEMVAIVDMCSLFQYLFYNTFFTKTNNVDFGKEDYFRLYPKKAKKLTFACDRNYDVDGYTLKEALELNMFDNIKIPYIYYVDENDKFKLNYDISINEHDTYELIKNKNRIEIIINNSSIGSIYAEDFNKDYEVSCKKGILNLKFSFKK